MKKKKFINVLIILVIIILVICAFILWNTIRTKQKNSIEYQTKTDKEVSKEIKDYLQKESDIKIKTLQALIKDNGITNLEFEFGSCSFDEENLYVLSYMIKQNNNLTSSILNFYFDEEQYLLAKATYCYNMDDISGNYETIDETTNLYITMCLPFSIDPIAFKDIDNTKLISMYSEMYEKEYAFLSGYKISITNFYNKQWLYTYKKVLPPS